MRLDRPSGGSDRPGDGNHPPRPNLDPWNQRTSRWDNPSPESREGVRSRDGTDGQTDNAGEGTGWPKDRPDAKPDKPKTLEERIKELEAANERLTRSYDSTLRKLQSTTGELSAAKMELANTKADRSRLIETNSNLVRDNMKLREKTAVSSDIDGRVKGAAAQDERIEKTPKRKNWFPSDKVGTLGGAVAGAAGSYAVMVGRAGSKEEAFAVACAGAGVATLAAGREVVDKVNAWRDKRAEKNADRPENQ